MSDNNAIVRGFDAIGRAHAETERAIYGDSTEGRPVRTRPLLDFLAELELRRDRDLDRVESARHQGLTGPFFEHTLPERYRRKAWDAQRLRSALEDAGIVDAAEGGEGGEGGSYGTNR